MAKPFYSMDEVCELLGKSADDVKGMVREGTLREFRDAGKVFFKAEDVDTIAGKSKSDTGMVLEPIGDEAPSAKDPGASDSITLEPVDDEDEPEGAKKDDTVITASGISVFDDDELEIDADPMAKTAISSALGDEVPLEGSGSGSGLLDLTREADDTSLGAELLDEIYPGEDEAAEGEPAAAEPVAEEEQAQEGGLEESPSGAEVVTPVRSLAAADPSEPIFSGLLVGVVILLAVGASVVGGVLQGFMPSYALSLSNKFWVFVGGSIGLVALTTLLGWVVGKASSPRRG